MLGLRIRYCGIRYWLLAVLSLLLTTAAVRSPQTSMAAHLPSATCADVQSVSKWTGTFTFSYSKSASGIIPPGPGSADASVSHSANVNVLLDQRPPGDSMDWFSY